MGEGVFHTGIIERQAD